MAAIVKKDPKFIEKELKESNEKMEQIMQEYKHSDSIPTKEELEQEFAAEQSSKNQAKSNPKIVTLSK